MLGLRCIIHIQYLFVGCFWLGRLISVPRILWYMIRNGRNIVFMKVREAGKLESLELSHTVVVVDSVSSSYSNNPTAMRTGISVFACPFILGMLSQVLRIGIIHLLEQRQNAKGKGKLDMGALSHQVMYRRKEAIPFGRQRQGG